MKEKHLWNLKIIYIIFDETKFFLSYQKKERGLNVGSDAFYPIWFK